MFKVLIMTLVAFVLLSMLVEDLLDLFHSWIVVIKGVIAGTTIVLHTCEDLQHEFCKSSHLRSSLC